MIGPPYPQLPRGFPFEKISPSIVGIEGLTRRGLADKNVDGPELLSFAQSSVRARLRELNLLSEISVAPPGGFDWRNDYPCDTLRVTFLIRTFDLDQGDKKAAAVVVNLMTWKGIEFQNSQGVNECQERPVPPLGGLDDMKFFTASTRDEAMAKSRHAILALIDTEILRRLLWTNDNARNLIEAWVGSSEAVGAD